MFQFQVETAVKSSSSTSLCSESSNDSNYSVDNNAVQVYSVGNRIKCENHLGTVRYIGTVAPHTGNWLGIEWDDPTRGRHDGSMNGIRYFKCSKPKAASFVRPSKVKKCKRITEAIRERYGHDPDLTNSIKDIDGGLERKKIEYSQLKIIDISAKQVSDLESPGILAEMSPKLEFLNVAENLIKSWKAIADVCQGLEHLKGLNISENPLEPVPDTVNEIDVFQGIEHLVLGKVKYDWDGVLKASTMWLNVKNIQLQYNKISRIIPPTSTLQHVTSLDLGGNQLICWNEILNLDFITGLEYLNLSGNRLSSIEFPASGEGFGQTDKFRNLARLNLTENSLADWQSINELNKLQSLQDLRVDTNPVFYNDLKVNNRQMIVARVGKLQKLEGVDITSRERRDSELDYIKKYARDWKSAQGASAFVKTHPRYAELLKVYGQSDDDQRKTEIKSMKTSLISLDLIPEDASKKAVTKKLLHTMTVQKLKMMLQRIFAIPGAHIDIKVVSSKNANITFVLDNDFFLLSQYSIDDGDKLYLKW